MMSINKSIQGHSAEAIFDIQESSEVPSLAGTLLNRPLQAGEEDMKSTDVLMASYRRIERIYQSTLPQEWLDDEQDLEFPEWNEKGIITKADPKKMQRGAVPTLNLTAVDSDDKKSESEQEKSEMHQLMQQDDEGGKSQKSASY